jgi:ABC-type nitrate/sulfonate/bicarbonate transport system permease component
VSAATTPPASAATSEAGTRRAGSRALGIVRAAALRLAVLAGFVAVWQAATTTAGSNFFPTPVEIFDRFVTVVTGGPRTDPLIDHLLPSLGRLAGGWSLAAFLGIVLGVAVGISAHVRDYLDPVIQFARAIPPPALLPLFLVLLGLGDSMKVAMIAFGVVWPILLNTIDGVRSVDAMYLDTGQAYGATPRDRLLRIVLPAATPSIFAGLRVSLSIAVILMVISELVAATSGVGFLLIQAQRTFRMLDMWAYVLVLAILGYLLNAALLAVERRFLRWHRAQQQTEAAEGAV